MYIRARRSVISKTIFLWWIDKFPEIYEVHPQGNKCYWCFNISQHYRNLWGGATRRNSPNDWRKYYYMPILRSISHFIAELTNYWRKCYYIPNIKSSVDYLEELSDATCQFWRISTIWIWGMIKEYITTGRVVRRCFHQPGRQTDGHAYSI